jgi:hypothetical protein
MLQIATHIESKQGRCTHKSTKRHGKRKVAIDWKKTKPQTEICVWKKTKPLTQNTSRWIKKKIGLKTYLNILTSLVKLDFEKNPLSQLSQPSILGHCAWPKVYHHLQWRQDVHYNHSILSGCGNSYNPTNL